VHILGPVTGHDLLSPAEARVLGSLVEKAMTTPEYYPLTPNALVAACNQRSNRDPVVDYDESTVTAALRSLEDRGLAGPTRSPGGRSVKYVHRAAATLQIDDRQLALLAVLLLRGPQTPGELRSRTDRYPSLAQADAVDEAVTDLIERDRPLVQRLARSPGQKEHRYRCVLVEDSPASDEPVPAASLEERVAILERRVEELEGRREEG
jgi:uncharacterized protein